MRVLVTGADGFVGKHLCQYLAQQGDEVHAVFGPVQGKSAHDEVERIDVLDGAKLARVVGEHRPEGVVHLAGFSSVAQSHAHPARAFEVNTLGTVHLLEAVRKGAPNARVLLVSSGEVYGNLDPEHAKSETSPTAPNSPYAAAKLAGEMAGMQYAQGYGLSVVVARPFNHIGPGQAPHFVVPSFARQLIAIRRGQSDARLEVGNLEPVRDFSHVRDVIAGYRLLLARGISGETYNVASGMGRTILSLVHELCALSGVDVTPTVVAERYRPSEIASLVGDASKLRALGWDPRHTVTDALREVLQEAEAA